ncbi:NAD-dependent epimerase/dehydratase family protein, partial [Sphingobacterium daejeonense]|uniref:NAD-dependent epimerase/dehydratase family protein n=1 Tax=Sphingobacterium daejeonense TaxID=371142 RepID=UPI003D3231F6
MILGIVGSTGFIGQYLSKELSNKFKLIEISLRDSEWRDKLSSCDIIINLVGKAHDHNRIATKDDFYYANLELTKQLFEVFKENASQLFIHISSIAAIEEIESEIPLNEDSKCNSSSWYGNSKREAELWLQGQQINENKKLIILRPPMIHGPNDKGNLGLLFKIISKGIPYPLGKFDNERSFISIYNFQYFLEEIINKRFELNNGIYNLADDETVST